MKAIVWFVFVLLLTTAGLRAAANDPRPRVLVLGDFHSQPVRGNPDWSALLAARLPEWNVVTDADFNRVFGPTVRIPKMKKGKPDGETVYPGLSERLNEILETHPPLSLVLIFLGTVNARTEIAAVTAVETLGDEVSSLIKKIQTHRAGRNALIGLVTPLPVVEHRLDQWSRESFAGGEQRCQQIAEEVRKAAQTTGVLLIDAWQFGRDRVDSEGRPGELLGSSGWIMREWAQRIFADWIVPRIAQLDVRAADETAFTVWQAERSARLRLVDLLASTCAGEVDHGAALDVIADETGKALRVKVPVEMLTGATLDLLIKPDGDGLSSVASANAEFGAVPVLKITLPNGEVVIKPETTASRLLDEAAPDTLIPGNRYGVNAGKWRPFPVVSSLPGQKRWLLLRFGLDALKGELPQAAECRIEYSINTAMTQILIDGTPAAYTPEAPFIQAAVFPVNGYDRDWNPHSATWRTRNGKSNWTGGTVNEQERRERIRAFLSEDIPESVKQDAAKYL